MKSKTKDKTGIKLSRGLKSFSVFDLVLLAMLTALSVAFKTVVGILVRLITGPLGIPGGALAGGFYMLWLPLAIVLIDRRGAAFLVAAVQTVIMVTTGAPGSHGVWTVFTYMLPAILVELVYLYRPHRGYNILHFIAATVLANLAGTIGSNLLFFRMSLYPLLFTLLAAALSGTLGGVVAWFAFDKVTKSGVLKKIKKKRKNATVFEKYGDIKYIRDDGSAVENGNESLDASDCGSNEQSAETTNCAETIETDFKDTVDKDAADLNRCSDGGDNENIE